MEGDSDRVVLRPLRLDMQFCPNNRRTIEVLAPMIVQRMHPGGVIITDCWKAYPEAARLAQCEHWTVNHRYYSFHLLNYLTIAPILQGFTQTA